MIRPLLRRGAHASVLALLLSSAASPAGVLAGGDAPDPCGSRVHFGGERVTFDAATGPTELVLSVTAGAEATDLRIGRIVFVDGERMRPVRAGAVTDDAGQRQPRRMVLAAGESKRLHVGIRTTERRESYVFAVEAVSGRCHYTAEVRARAARPQAQP